MADPKPAFVEMELVFAEGPSRSFATNLTNAESVVGMLRAGVPLDMVASDRGDPEYFCLAFAKGEGATVKAVVLRPHAAAFVQVGVPLIERARAALAALVLTETGQRAIGDSPDLNELVGVLLDAVSEDS